MKKVLLILAGVIAAGTMVFAQDMKKATELAQSANEEFMNENFEAALEGFRAALAEAEKCEDGADLVNTCQGVIPTILYSMGNKLVEAGSMEEAIAKFKESKEEALKFENAEAAEKAGKQIVQIYMKQGGDFLNNKQFAEAEAAYAQAIEADPTNGTAYIRLALAQQQQGKMDEAEASFNLAAENGQAAEAEKRIKSLELQKISSSFQAKKYPETIAMANAYLEKYGENADARVYQFLLYSCINSNKLNEASDCYNKYAASFPTAKNKGEYAFRIAVAYHKANNLAKAKEFYALAVDDPKYGKTAKETLDSLK